MTKIETIGDLEDILSVLDSDTPIRIFDPGTGADLGIYSAELINNHSRDRFLLLYPSPEQEESC